MMTPPSHGNCMHTADSFTSRYARLLIGRRPDFAEMIETRELRAA